MGVVGNVVLGNVGTVGLVVVGDGVVVVGRAVVVVVVVVGGGAVVVVVVGTSAAAATPGNRVGALNSVAAAETPRIACGAGWSACAAAPGGVASTPKQQRAVTAAPSIAPTATRPCPPRRASTLRVYRLAVVRVKPIPPPT